MNLLSLVTAQSPRKSEEFENGFYLLKKSLSFDWCKYFFLFWVDK